MSKRTALTLSCVLFVIALGLSAAQDLPFVYVKVNCGTSPGCYEGDGTSTSQIVTPGVQSSGPHDSSPSPSPDGTRVAFVRASGSYGGDIYVMNVADGSLARLTYEENNFQPAWSPTGSQIAFVSYRTERWEIYLMNPDGSNVTRLTHDVSSANGYPSWSPDGRRIAFDCYNSTTLVLDICLLNTDGSGLVRLSSHAAFDSWNTPNWSPDGTKLAFSIDGRLATMNVDGSELRMFDVSNVTGFGPRWSPDGSLLAYTGFEANQYPSTWAIYTVRPDGSNVTKVFSSANSPAWIRHGPAGATGCSASPGTVQLCSPASGATISDAVQFAGAASLSGLVLMRLYVDDQQVFETAQSAFGITLNLAAGQHHAVLVAYASSGDRTTDTFFSVTTSGGGGGGVGSCTAAANTANLCMPANGSTVSSPVAFTGATNAATVYLQRLYVDDQPVFDTSNSSFSTSINVGAGFHHAVLVAYTSAGDLTSQSFFSVGASTGGATGSCPLPSTNATILICSPTEGATVNSPVVVMAQARWDGHSIGYMRIYVDDQPAFEQSNPANGSVNSSVTMSTGAHRIVIVGWDSSGAAIVSPTRNVTVQ